MKIYLYLTIASFRMMKDSKLEGLDWDDMDYFAYCWEEKEFKIDNW
jgi:hypothetical protein